MVNRKTVGLFGVLVCLIGLYLYVKKESGQVNEDQTAGVQEQQENVKDVPPAAHRGVASVDVADSNTAAKSLEDMDVKVQSLKEAEQVVAKQFPQQKLTIHKKMSDALKTEDYNVFWFQQFVGPYKVFDSYLALYTDPVTGKVLLTKNLLKEISQIPSGQIHEVHEIVSQLADKHKNSSKHYSLIEAKPLVFVSSDLHVNLVYQFQYSNPKDISQAEVLLVDVSTGEVIHSYPTTVN